MTLRRFSITVHPLYSLSPVPVESSMLYAVRIALSFYFNLERSTLESHVHVQNAIKLPLITTGNTTSAWWIKTITQHYHVVNKKLAADTLQDTGSSSQTRGSDAWRCLNTLPIINHNRRLPLLPSPSPLALV